MPGSRALLFLRGALLLQQSLSSCLLCADNNSYRTWRSLSIPEIRPQALSKVHIELKAEQRRKTHEQNQQDATACVGMCENMCAKACDLSFFSVFLAEYQLTLNLTAAKALRMLSTKTGRDPISCPLFQKCKPKVQEVVTQTSALSGPGFSNILQLLTPNSGSS